MNKLRLIILGIAAVVLLKTNAENSPFPLANPGFENGKNNWFLDKTGSIEKENISAGRSSLRIKNKNRKYCNKHTF